MLIDFVEYFLCLYVFLLIFCTIYRIVTILLKKNKRKQKELKPVSFIYYVCLFSSFVCTSAFYLNLKDFDSSIVWFYFLFGGASLVSMFLVIWSVMWKIEYDDTTLIYRNVFGIKKKYYINNIMLVQRNQYTYIINDNKKVTSYNFHLMNVFEVIEFEKTILAKK